MSDDQDYALEFKHSGNPNEDIPKLIKWRGDGLSFVELLRYLPYLKGEQSIAWSYNNLILWWGVSDLCIEAIGKLKRDGMISLDGTSALTYVADGIVPKAPMAKNLRDYKKQRWLPTTLSLTKEGRNSLAA
jgi:hypothetical protein